MNYSDRYLRQIANYSTMDVMLADVAIRIQLGPTDYQLAVDHYHAINDWLERDDSPLKGYVRDFYTQGGFAIGATVARHSSDDEFDIDVMADLAFRADVDPEDALATLHDAIRGERGSRYHLKTDRKTRCSTVNYDGMHLDVTPTVRLPGTIEKTGLIFHSKPEEPWAKKSLFANPHGFAQWFMSKTPPDQDFGNFFERRSLDYDRERAILSKRADAVPVPQQSPAYQKSRAVIALQLIKRWRNLAYDKRHPNRRLPPSVLLAYYVANHANRAKSLVEELCFQAESMLAILGEAHDHGEKVFASNPVCNDDILTDRWPTDLSDQAILIRELGDLTGKLRRLSGEIRLPEMQQILEDLFGEKPARSAVKDHVLRVGKDVGSNGSRFMPGKATISAAVAGGAAAPSVAFSAPPHRFFGDHPDDLPNHQ
ncbi:nucleotidyltransferase [Bradyrhizobium sp. 199]|uniref:nucleotidyltransferase domain-containing protein n=1 Tax=Bradyrhizobium sp. 199 TaxID=2782664 RepID=UPI001FFA14E9|nr:nucleotidyltransferase [Bradyrhizobium sp. 199]MCK1360480.1 nucleotidyltransferase [Bradyrhizobium sp. 199]